MTTISTTSSHSGALTGSASTTVHARALLAMIASTSRDRRCGWRPVKMPIDDARARWRRRPRSSAARPPTPVDRPCATVRYGTPHISAKTVTENWVPMWVKKPSRVPGRSHTVLTLASVSRIGRGLGFGTPAVRSVLDQRQGQHDRQHAERGHRDVGGGPARPGEQGA